MKIFKLLTTSATLSSSSNSMSSNSMSSNSMSSNLHTTDLGKIIVTQVDARKYPVACDDNKRKCPKDSYCMKIYGEAGYCVLLA